MALQHMRLTRQLLKTWQGPTMEQVPLVAKECVKEIGTFFNQHSHKDPQKYAPEDTPLAILCSVPPSSLAR